MGRTWWRTPEEAGHDRQTRLPLLHRASASARSHRRTRSDVEVADGAEPTIATMTIPTRADAAKILRDLNPPDWHLAHSEAVADIAAFLGAKIEERGHAINVLLVETASLLHDVGKVIRPDHKESEEGHAARGAQWLREHGYDEIAGAVATHPVTLLADDEHYSIWSRDATVEERLVSYADKRATSDLVPMEDRFARWIKKHGDNDFMRVAIERARILEREVCAAAGVAPEEVVRTRWAEAAVAASVG
jgi:putative nucleotidyltransferase with HDIG domain